jgi:D-psicose/D-tagatose/L-ribulose 3-epimerase
MNDWEADFHPFIDKVSALGFDILEVNAGAVADLTSLERKALKIHADDKGLILTHCIGLPPECDLAAEDRSLRLAGIAYLRRLIEAIGEMGGGLLGGIIYGAWPASLPAGTKDKRPYVERSLASMREVIKPAEDLGVILNMEVVNRFEQFILNTCQEALAYVEALESPNAKIQLDTFHMNIEEDFIGAAIESAGSKLGHLHTGENNRRPPGCGHIPWTEIGAALRRIDYRGYIVMEPFLKPGGEVGRDIKVFRDLSAGLDLDREAQQALAFIRSILA